MMPLGFTGETLLMQKVSPENCFKPSLIKNGWAFISKSFHSSKVCFLTHLELSSISHGLHQLSVVAQLVTWPGSGHVTGDCTGLGVRGRSHPWSWFNDGLCFLMALLSLILRLIGWSSLYGILAFSQSMVRPVSERCSHIAQDVNFLCLSNLLPHILPVSPIQNLLQDLQSILKTMPLLWAFGVGSFGWTRSCFRVFIGLWYTLKSLMLNFLKTHASGSDILLIYGNLIYDKYNLGFVGRNLVFVGGNGALFIVRLFGCRNIACSLTGKQNITASFSK